MCRYHIQWCCHKVTLFTGVYMDHNAVRLAIERVKAAKADRDFVDAELKAANLKFQAKVADYKAAVGNFGTVAGKAAFSGVLYKGVLYQLNGNQDGVNEIPKVDAVDVTEPKAEPPVVVSVPGMDPKQLDDAVERLEKIQGKHKSKPIREVVIKATSTGALPQEPQSHFPKPNTKDAPNG